MTLNNQKKIYSAREILQYIPQIASEPILRKMIREDMKGDNVLGVIIQNIGKRQRFFIPEKNLKNFIKKYVN